MLQHRDLPRSEWRPFFDGLSKALIGKSTEIEVAGADLGDQLLAEWIPMLGISYDTKSDRLDLMLARTSHAIEHPERIGIDEDSNGVSVIAVVDREGQRTVVTLKEPLSLPGARGN